MNSKAYPAGSMIKGYLWKCPKIIAFSKLKSSSESEFAFHANLSPPVERN